MKTNLRIPGIAETIETGVLASTSTELHGYHWQLDFSLIRGWEFKCDGRPAAPFGDEVKAFAAESRAVIRGYLKAHGAAAMAAAAA